MTSINTLLTCLQYLAMEEISPITTDDDCEPVNTPVNVLQAAKGSFEQLLQLIQETAESTARPPENPIFHAFDTAKRATIFDTFSKQLPSVQRQKILCTGGKCPTCREFLNQYVNRSASSFAF